MAKGSRVDQYAIHVSVDDDTTGIWDKMSGGAVDSDEQKYKPGGMEPQLALGGSKQTDNVTVSRIYDLDRDHNGLVKHLLAKAGRAKVVIKKQPLDPDGNPFGDPIVYKGILKSCTPPEPDSESTDASMLEIEVSTAGEVG